MTVEVGGRGGVMRTYRWKQVPTKETEMAGVGGGAWLVPLCLSTSAWCCMEKENAEVAVENR